MSRKSISKTSKTDWARLEKMADDEIDLSEIPETTAEQLSRATLRFGGKAISTGDKQSNFFLEKRSKNSFASNRFASSHLLLK